MTEISPRTNIEFVRKAKELLKTITGVSYSTVEESYLEGCIWGIRPNLNRILEGGASWVQEEKDGTIRLSLKHFYEVNNVASEEYDLDLWIGDDLLEKKNWEKYRRRVPGLIADLEAAERIANEVNAKYDTNIRLWAYQKPYFETSFNSRGMSEDRKLHEIGKHAMAINEAFRLWDERAINA